jgi:imidazoleglycerol-phosphate dehydratase/histidinol-phosphatase
MKRKALFIDRDGTIIREPADEQIDSLEKLEFVPGAITALCSLMGRGYDFVMVSNQDGLGTDAYPESTFWPAHRKMLTTLAGEGIEFDRILIDRSCAADNAPTRKPRTGLLADDIAAGTYDFDESFVIGDRATDVEFARNLGAKAILLTADRPDRAPSAADVEDAWLVTSSWQEAARAIMEQSRCAHVYRHTSETDIDLTVDLSGTRRSGIDTGLKFFDHMLWQIPHHAGISLQLTCRGDLQVDEHHTMEDVAIALGSALEQALGDKMGIDRYGFVLPMDESRAMVLIDLGGRADFLWDVEFTREYVGDTPTEMYSHFFHSLSSALKCNLQVTARGENNHHLIEGVFKAFARALRMAVQRNPFSHSLPSSKGIL